MPVIGSIGPSRGPQRQLGRDLGLAVVVCLCSVGQLVAAEPPLETWLPESTRAFAVADDWRRFLDTLPLTSLGRAWEDEHVRPVLDQLLAKSQAAGSRWMPHGVTIEELDTLCSGGGAIALVEAGPKTAAAVLLVDVAAYDRQTRALINRVEKRLVESGGKSERRQVAGQDLVVVALPAEGDLPAREAVMALVAGRLVLSNHVETAAGILERAGKADAPSLASVPEFRDLMRDTTLADRDPAYFRFFLRPIELMLLLEPVDPLADPNEPYFVDKHGFRGVRGMGGQGWLATPTMDVEYRVGVLAPEPREKGLRLLSFRAGGEFAPAPWIPRDVNTFTCMQWELGEILTNVGPLFDDLVGDGIEGTFAQLLDDIRADDGPGVDLQREVLGRLGPRVVLVNDLREPIDVRSERTLVAIEAREEAQLADAIKALFRDDPDVKRLTVEGFPHDLWQIGSESRASDEGPGFSSLGLMVARGHLLICTQFDGLRRFLAPDEALGPALTAEPDFARAAACWQAWAHPREFQRLFSRMDRDFLAPYELLRQGKAVESESPLVQALKFARDAGGAEAREGQAAAVEDWPPFTAWQPFLGTGVMSSRVESWGWLIAGGVLPRDPADAASR